MPGVTVKHGPVGEAGRARQQEGGGSRQHKAAANECDHGRVFRLAVGAQPMPDSISVSEKESSSVVPTGRFAALERVVTRVTDVNQPPSGRLIAATTSVRRSRRPKCVASAGS